MAQFAGCSRRGDLCQRAGAAKEHGGGGSAASAASPFNRAQTFHTSLRLIIPRDAAQALELYILSNKRKQAIWCERTAFTSKNSRPVEGGCDLQQEGRVSLKWLYAVVGSSLRSRHVWYPTHAVSLPPVLSVCGTLPRWSNCQFWLLWFVFTNTSHQAASLMMSWPISPTLNNKGDLK